MTRNGTLDRWTLAALSAAALTIAIAPKALADPGWRRWKHADHGRWGHSEQRVVYRETDRGSAAPVLAGLLGGFVLGATMTHPHAVLVRERECAPPPPRYRYEDAGGDRWWDTLDECRDAAYDRYGPRVIRVVDDRTGRCVQVYYWKHDHFISDSDREDGYRDQGRGNDNRDDNN
jgi:hypothetical protein